MQGLALAQPRHVPIAQVATLANMACFAPKSIV